MIYLDTRYLVRLSLEDAGFAAVRAMLAQFEADQEAEAIRWLPSGPDVLQRLREVYAGLPPSVYLRGADALHLATAAINRFRAIYSHDAHLLAAASHFGIKGVNLITKS